MSCCRKIPLRCRDHIHAGMHRQCRKSGRLLFKTKNHALRGRLELSSYIINTRMMIAVIRDSRSRILVAVVELSALVCRRTLHATRKRCLFVGVLKTKNSPSLVIGLYPRPPVLRVPAGLQAAGRARVRVQEGGDDVLGLQGNGRGPRRWRVPREGSVSGTLVHRR